MSKFQESGAPDEDFGAASSQGSSPGRSAHQIRHMAEVRLLTPAELDERRIIHAFTSNREALNAFRELRVQLLQRAGRRNFVVLITTVAPEGGATFSALNLAASFALDSAKTALMVDCNFYSPSVEKLLFVEPEHGLTDFLEDHTLDVDDIIYASGIPRLRVIPVGHQRATGTEYYSSTRMEMFVHGVRLRYPDRYIILDGPPVGMYPDSRILADLADYVVLIVPYGKVNQEQVQMAIEALPEGKLLGVVFNHG
ncbi:Polysaccharide biosynthesis protein [gamma proteobacterium HdN1]|nr:Polysaccharide biosynthesis protein [gamma proteobacterium HdN1]